MKKTQKGFTIIEVALVLAIGALIFLVVFLAVPALQRNQRNDAKKRDISNVVQAIADYAANNPAVAIPASGTPGTEHYSPKSTTLGKYLDTLSNQTANVKATTAGSLSGISADGKTATADEISTIRIYQKAKCNDLHSIKSGTARSYAVVGITENGSGYEYYCQDAS